MLRLVSSAPDFALLVSGLFDILLLAFAIYVATLFVPMMAALFWTKATRTGATTSAIASLLTLGVLYGMKFAGRLPETDRADHRQYGGEPDHAMVSVSVATWRAPSANDATGAS